MNRVRLLALLAVAALAPRPAVATDPASAENVFRTMQTLVGGWSATLENGKSIGIRYGLTSNDHVLLETFTTPSGKQTISVYHPDGDDFLLTHYCGMGNFPRLRYSADRSDPSRLVFEFLDAANLEPGDGHMVRLEASILDEDHFDQTSEYTDGEESETMTLHFVRVAPESSRSRRDSRTSSPEGPWR